MNGDQLATLAVLTCGYELTIDTLTLKCGQQWALVWLDGAMIAAWEVGT